MPISEVLQGYAGKFFNYILMANDKGKINAPEVHVISSDDENKAKVPDELISVSSEVESQDERGAGNQAAGTVKTSKVLHKKMERLENIENIDLTHETRMVVVVCQVAHETSRTNDDDYHHNNDNNNM